MAIKKKLVMGGGQCFFKSSKISSNRRIRKTEQKVLVPYLLSKTSFPINLGSLRPKLLNVGEPLPTLQISKLSKGPLSLKIGAPKIKGY